VWQATAAGPARRVSNLFTCACATLETRCESWCFKASKLKDKHQELAQAPGWKEEPVALCTSCIKTALGLWSQIGGGWGERKWCGMGLLGSCNPSERMVAWTSHSLSLCCWPPHTFLHVGAISKLAYNQCKLHFLKALQDLEAGMTLEGSHCFLALFVVPCSLQCLVQVKVLSFSFFHDSALRSGSVLINATSRTLRYKKYQWEKRKAWIL